MDSNNSNNINNNNNSNNNSNSNNSNNSINNSSNSNNNNNSNNNISSNNNSNNRNEILFWKVFNNIVIRNHILSQLNTSSNSNSNGRQYRSYNGTTSLEFMVEHNKIDMILDKLKSNHFIYFDSIPDIYNICGEQSIDPYFKVKVDEIYKLLWFNYSGHIKAIYSSYGLYRTPFAIYKLWYINNNSNCSSGNNYVHYREHELYDQYLKYGNSEYDQFFKDIIKNNNQINQNMDQQEFIRQLSLSNSISSLSDKSIVKEILDAIYNDKEIPVNYFKSKEVLIDFDIFKNRAVPIEIDIKSILLSSTHIKIKNCTNQEILESIYLALLYKDTLVVDLSGRGVNLVDNVLLAKIKVLNRLNMKSIRWDSKFDSSGKFKRYLMDNKVDTLDELIWLARETIIDDQYYNTLKYNFGNHYHYLYLVSKYSNLQLQNKNLLKPQERINTALVLCYSVINQSIEAFNNEFNLLFVKNRQNYDLRYIQHYKIQMKQLNSAASGNNTSNNHDQSIKDKSTQYFNHLLIKIKMYGSQAHLTFWMEIFKIIIYNYNSKLFDWLLDSNQALRDIYYRLLSHDDYKLKIYSAHSRFNRDTNQINYEMFNIYLKHMGINGFKFTTDYLTKKKKRYYNQQNQSILNHIIKSTTNNSNSFIRSLAKTLVVEVFKNISTDQIIQMYNQIDQESLSNLFNNIQDTDNDDDILVNRYKSYRNQMFRLYNKAYNNKSSILEVHLIKSIIKLDFESINKIISTTLNSNNTNNSNNKNSNKSTNTPITINIPTTTINNSIDLFKYLITNNYLKQFNLHYIMTEFISKVNVDKQIILDIIKSQSINNNNNNDSNNNSSNNSNKSHDSLELIDKLYIDLESNVEKFRDQFRRKEERLNSENSLQALENSDKYWVNYKIWRCLSDGYFNSVYQFKLMDKSIGYGVMHYIGGSFKESSISVEWFSKLYSVWLKNAIKSSKDINELCYYNLDIFEFIWANHFKNDNERKKYLVDCLASSSSFFSTYSGFLYTYHHQLVEHILQSKKEFISTSLVLDQDQIFKLHKDMLFGFNFSISLFNQVRSIYPSFKFNIDYNIIHKLTIQCRYDEIEYLYENNLIPNLHQIIGQDNLNRLTIRCFPESYQPRIFSTTLSVFILIHSIIKLQQNNNLIKI